MQPDELQALLGGADIYLLDQILRGRIAPGMAIFDAGCGGGRNLVYLLRSGFVVAGVELGERLGGELADPLKTTVVQDQRSMTTWVLRKRRC